MKALFFDLDGTLLTSSKTIAPSTRAALQAVRQKGVKLLELDSVNDEHHMHFYKKLGFYAASNLAMMGKHFN